MSGYGSELDPRTVFDRETRDRDPLRPWQRTILANLKEQAALTFTERHLDALQERLLTLGYLTPEVDDAIENLEKLVRSTVVDARTSIVQVKFEGTYKSYNYIDPSGTLRVGDRVLVPVGPQYSGADPNLKPAVISGLGRSRDWKHPITKSVASRLTEEPLS